MKRCTGCGIETPTPYYLCPNCRHRYPAYGMEWRQTGVNEITIYAPDNINIIVSPIPTGRKFAAVMRKSVLGNIKGAAEAKISRLAGKVRGLCK